MSRRQRLLDDDSSEQASDDYVAYSAGSSDQPSSSRRKKYIIGGVIAAIVILIAAAAIGYYVWYAREHDNDDTPTDDVPQVAKNYRLPANVVPSRYELDFSVDMTGPFGGTATIYATITNHSMDAFVLHSMGLTISAVNITVDNTVVNSTDYKFYLFGQQESTASGQEDAQQYLVIQGVNGHRFVVTNSLVLKIQYNGTMPTNRSNGLYLTFYNNSLTNALIPVAVTQFEPTHARRAFPCFDEPAMKAVFSVKMTVPSELVALSNGIQVSSSPVTNNQMQVTFADSVKQSSYLIAFAVSNFQNVSASASVGLSYPFMSWGRPDRFSTMQDMTNRAAAVQKFFHEYLNVTWHSAKQDQIAVPNKGGAMENIGLVTYAEALLYIDADTTSSMYGGALGTNSHELAHMLWGDWMTPKWWSDNWLKEGSATFWAMVGQNEIMLQAGVGDWHSDSLAANGYVESALQADSNINTPPLIDPNVLTPWQIQNHFGSGWTYNKGGAFLRQIRAIMGLDSFLAGCRDFLRDFALSNAWSTDFFDYLEFHNDRRNGSVLSDIFYEWASQSGFPLIVVSESESNGQYTWTLTQQRYTAPMGQDTSRRWTTWIEHVDTKTNATNSVWLDSKNNYENTVTFAANTLLKLNFNRTGFYRVQYPLSVYQRFSDMIGRQAIYMPQNDRISLIHDAWQLQLDGYLGSWDTVLNLTHVIVTTERWHAPMAAGISRLNDLWSRIRHTGDKSVGNAFGAWMSKLFDDITFDFYWGPLALNSVITEGNPHNMTAHLIGLMQQTLAPIACKWKVYGCSQRMAEPLLLQWLNTSVLPHPNVRSAVFEYAPLEISGYGYDYLVGCYINSQQFNDSVAMYCLNGVMAHATSLDIQYVLKQLLAGTLPRRTGDTIASLLSRLIARNDEARGAIMDYFTDPNNSNQWEQLKSMVSSSDLRSIVNLLVGTIQNQDHLNAATSYFNSRITSGDAVYGAYQTAISSANNNIRWVSANWPSIKAWISAYIIPPVIPPM